MLQEEGNVVKWDRMKLHAGNCVLAPLILGGYKDKHMLESQKKVGVKGEWVCITLRYPSFQETKSFSIEIS